MKNKISGNTVLRVGGWLPSKQETLESWLTELIREVEREKKPLHPVIEEFKWLIEHDPEVYMWITQMIAQVPKRGKYKKDPIGGHQIRDYHQMLELINAVLTKAPEFNKTDLVGFPINAILDWSMGTHAGFAAFLNDKVNAALKKILNVWCEFLDSEGSLYVLNDTDTGWMCEAAQQAIGIEQFEYQPGEPFWGFTSWNDFFTRKFKKGARPVAAPREDKVIVSACESTPYQISTNVQKHSKFWIKSQPYSLEFMLDSDEYVDQFVGGTVYQAFLSACNYHRWHSPVSGTIKKAFVKQGSYYAEAYSEGFDPAGPNLSQGYITQVATRAIIFIECDDPIGLMCLMPVGMAEVSSCKITVKEGQPVKKGDPVGYFQYGGSTHCLIFRPGVIAEFTLDAIPQPDAKVVKVNSHIATAN
jgi:phosphatidylserine decarboxylase